MHDLTGFQRDCLVAIAGLDGPKRLEVKGELDGYDEGEIDHGRLYPNLDTLVEKGLVEKGRRDERTNEYALTRRGRRELEARSEWERRHVEING
jgi:DNA-binding PadR family transcriptional regulator